MEHTLVGVLDCKNFAGSKALRRHLERRLEEWANTVFGEGHRRRVVYDASLQKMAAGRSFACEISVASSAGSWHGADWGATPEEAILHALLKLQLKTAAPTSLRAAGAAQDRSKQA